MYKLASCSQNSQLYKQLTTDLSFRYYRDTYRYRDIFITIDRLVKKNFAIAQL